MKGLIVFFIVFILVYVLLNVYICPRGASLLPKITWLKATYFTAYIILAGSYIIGRALLGIIPDALSNALMFIGAYWFAFMVFFLFAFLLIDIIRLVHHFTGFVPNIILNNINYIKPIAAAVIMLGITITVIAGRLNADNVIVKTVPVTIEKKTQGLSSLKVVLISDIHLGLMVQRDELSHIVELSNKEEPDIVLLCGDIFDERVEPVKAFNAKELLSAFKSKYGTFAVTGNHEYIGTADAAVEYLRESGIIVLRDESILIANSFYVSGRDDFSSESRSGVKRLPLEEIVAKLDKTKPIILMDHQPKDLNITAACNIDLQVSGHTHAGQLWPWSMLVNAAWEVPYGYAKKEKSQIYVTSGAGTWGPRVRIGTTPEIVVMNINFIE